MTGMEEELQRIDEVIRIIGRLRLPISLITTPTPDMVSIQLKVRNMITAEASSELKFPQSSRNFLPQKD